MAWQIEQELACSGCGFPRDETMDRDAQFGFTSSAVRCHACAAAERARKKFAAQDGADLSGLTFSVKPSGPT